MNHKIDSSIENCLHGISGSIASTTTTLLIYPIENIKQRLIQNNNNNCSKSDLQTNNNNIENQIKIKSQKEKIIQIIRQVYEKEGISGFYSGMTPLLTGNFISYGLYFFWYELFKNYFGAEISDIIGYSKAACLSGIITTLGSNPFWVIQTRMAFQKERENFLKVSVNMVKQEGLSSLFKGLEASLGLVWNPIIQFIVYENLKKKFCKKMPEFLVNFLAGAISKAISTIFTYPYQLIRTHSHIVNRKKRNEYFKIIQQIYEKEGLKGFYRGMTNKMSSSVLNAAFMLAIYEFTYKLIKQLLIILTKKIITNTKIQV